MTAAWISLDRTMSPVQASVRLVRELKASGRGDIISLSIGAESESPPPETEIGRLLSAGFTCSPDYNSAVGGLPHVRDAAAGWIRRFIGLPAHGGNTFLMQTNGRDLLNHAFHFGAQKHILAGKKPALLLPDTSWPMVNESARDSYFREVYYPLFKTGFAAAVFEAAEDIPSGDLAAIYTNSPHNPTGICASSDEMEILVKTLDKHNEATGDRVMHIIDNPYFSGSAQSPAAPYMKSGYEGVIAADSVTPWIAIISFSKAFGTAQPGLSVMTVHNGLSGAMTARLARNNGLSYAPSFFENMARIFDPRNDGDALEHFRKLRTKYEANRAAAREMLGGAMTLLDGDPGMTCLFEAPPDIFGKALVCSDGLVRTINDVSDLVEFIGNEMGVVVVNNSVPGRSLIRVALRERPELMRGAFQAINKGLERILNARTVAAA